MRIFPSPKNSIMWGPGVLRILDQCLSNYISFKKKCSFLWISEILNTNNQNNIVIFWIFQEKKNIIIRLFLSVENLAVSVFSNLVFRLSNGFDKNVLLYFVPKKYFWTAKMKLDIIEGTGIVSLSFIIGAGVTVIVLIYILFRRLGNFLDKLKVWTHLKNEDLIFVEAFKKLAQEKVSKVCTCM